MKHALHCICHRKPNGAWDRSTPVVGERGLYRSIWNLAEDEARSLVDGFIYFHETSKERSVFTGMIEDYLWKPDGVVLFVRELVGVSQTRWRGKSKPSAHYPFGGLVPADLPHEA
jgi:hypothetical protein